MTDTTTWLQVSAACAECGRPVFFEQFGPHSFMAVCADDPEHVIGPAAQLALDKLRRDNRPQ